MALPPYDPGADTHLNDSRRQNVRAVTFHRTVGTWPGDHSVGKNRHHDTPGTFNYLIGQDEGQHACFYPADVRCSHAAGANQAGPGIEFSGQNGEPLTDWQVRAGGELVRWLAAEFGVPLVFHDFPRISVDGSGFAGFVTHSAVATQPQWLHYDYITGDEWSRMTTVAAPDFFEEPSMFFVVNEGKYAGRRLVAAGPRVLHLSPEQAAALKFQKVPGIDITSGQYRTLTSFVQRVRQV